MGLTNLTKPEVKSFGPTAPTRNTGGDTERQKQHRYTYTKWHTGEISVIHTRGGMQQDKESFEDESSLSEEIGCGDVFENSVVDQFNDCAVSRKKCVPQKPDLGDFPVPQPSALVPSFNTTEFTGKWYISSGLNPTFDTFDCQLHEFSTSPNKLTGKLSWRIKTPDGGFFTRSALRSFMQDQQHQGILYNHDPFSICLDASSLALIHSKVNKMYDELILIQVSFPFSISFDAPSSRLSTFF
ncbi:hypothetical protein L7F22_051159 [Adiantum nelumboides]|nr:hypothetical protein [Adiantum nelumboides]